MVGRMLSRIGLCSLLAAGCSESSGPLAPCTAAAPLVDLTAGEYQSADPRPSGDFVLRAVRGAGCVAFAANPSGSDIEYLLVPQAATGTPGSKSSFWLSDADFLSLGYKFDTRLYVRDTLAFGRESDIDQNGVVIVLMTNAVNQLVSASECSAGFVAGYFYGADLIFGQGNNGEVFYSLVADPLGTLSCPHSVAQVNTLVPVTFIHEFQHIVLELVDERHRD